MIEESTVKAAVEQLKTGTNSAYFFGRISTPDWIIPLRDRGFFKRPPKLESHGESFSCAYWPESQYLVRVANVAPRVVCETILLSESTDNFRVRTDYLAAASKMPSEYAVKIAEQEIEFVKGSKYLTFLYPDQYSQLVQALAREGKFEAALKMFTSILAVRPAVQKKKHLGKSYESKIDYYDYEKVLSQCYPVLFENAPVQTFQVLCNLLNDIMSCDVGMAEYDYSYITRPAIEDHEQNKQHVLGVDSTLISLIRDSGDNLLASSNAVVFSTLKLFRYGIFKRIDLHLRTKWFDIDQEGLTQLLFGTDFDKEIGLHHELFCLLEEHFDKLDAKVREKYLAHARKHMSFVEFQDTRHSWGNQEVTQEDWLRSKRITLYRHLLPVARFLEDVDKMEFAELDKEFKDVVEHPDLLSYSSTGWVGPTSPIEDADIAGMSVKKLVDFLKSWEPDDDDFSPSPEGLGRKLSSILKQDPDKYTHDSQLFVGLDPTYVKAFFYGLREALREQKVVNDWHKIAELAEWAIRQNDIEVRRKPRRAVVDADHDWNETRKTIASFFEDALRVRKENNVPFELRKQIWSIIEVLTNDLQPDHEKDYTLEGPGFDEYTTSINNTRGCALHATVIYALWVMDRFKNEGKDDINFDLMPEVKAVLDKHLDAKLDPILAIRAVYGKWFPWLLTIDKHWTQSNKETIFPKEKEQFRYFLAAWKAYCYNNFYRNVFYELKEEYTFVTNLWKLAELGEDKMPLGLKTLLEHCGIAYLKGDLELHDELLRNSLALSDECAYHVTHMFARFLYYEAKDGELDTLIEERLRAYWDARKALNPKHKELAAFDLWFASGKMDKEWAIRNLQYVLDRVEEIDSQDDVVEGFLPYVEGYSKDILRCLKLLVEKDKWGILSHDHKSKMRQLLEKLLLSNDSDVSKKTVDLIHFLGAKGYASLRNLLRRDGAKDKGEPGVIKTRR